MAQVWEHCKTAARHACDQAMEHPSCLQASAWHGLQIESCSGWNCSDTERQEGKESDCNSLVSEFGSLITNWQGSWCKKLAGAHMLESNSCM